MPEEAVFKVVVTGPGLNLTREVSQEVALAITGIAFGVASVQPMPASASPAARMPAAAVLPSTSGYAEAGPPLSLRELVSESGAATNPQIIVVIANHILTSKATDEFEKDVILPMFAQAGELPPKNFSRDFQSAVANGWIAEYPDREGKWYLTRTGISALKAGFPKDLKKNSTRKRRRTESESAGDGEE